MNGGFYGFYRRHVAHLLELTDLGLDSDAHADHLFASLDASLVHHQ